MAAADVLARSTCALSVTWPRPSRRRSASRTSFSQRANEGGSLSEGLKNRWLTDRSSTVTRAPATSPSAAPYPVMLRIMGNRLSYGATRRLSIPEAPPHTVVLRLPRHQVAGGLPVDLTQQVAVLVCDDRVEEADLDDARQRSKPVRAPEASRAARKERRRLILVHERDEQAEIPSREALRQRRREIDLAARLILRPVEARAVPPHGIGVGADRPVEPSTELNEGPRCRRLGVTRGRVA